MEERPPEPAEPGQFEPPPPIFGSEPPLPPPPPPPGPPAAPPPIPWEQPGVDIFSAFFRTIGLLLSSPRKAFERVPATGGLGRPFAFGLIVGLLGIWGDTFWKLVLADWWKSILPSGGEQWEVSTTTEVALGLSAPLWVPIVILVATALQHLFLFLVGGARGGFKATLRALCYSWAAYPLALIPVCGQVAGSLWGIVLSIIGLAVLHRISYTRAAFGVFLPLLLCCGCVAIGIALFGAAILSSLHGRM